MSTPYGGLPKTQTAGGDFWNMLAKMGLQENMNEMPPPGGAAPFSMNQEQVEAGGGLAALARSRGKPGGGFGVMGGGGTQYPDKQDAGGNTWRWDPTSKNYKKVR